MAPTGRLLARKGDGAGRGVGDGGARASVTSAAPRLGPPAQAGSALGDGGCMVKRLASSSSPANGLSREAEEADALGGVSPPGVGDVGGGGAWLQTGPPAAAMESARNGLSAIVQGARREVSCYLFQAMSQQRRDTPFPARAAEPKRHAHHTVARPQRPRTAQPPQMPSPWSRKTCALSAKHKMEREAHTSRVRNAAQAAHSAAGGTHATGR